MLPSPQIKIGLQESSADDESPQADFSMDFDWGYTADLLDKVGLTVPEGGNVPLCVIVLLPVLSLRSITDSRRVASSFFSLTAGCTDPTLVLPSCLRPAWRTFSSRPTSTSDCTRPTTSAMEGRASRLPSPASLPSPERGTTTSGDQPILIYQAFLTFADLSPLLTSCTLVGSLLSSQF